MNVTQRTKTIIDHMRPENHKKFCLVSGATGGIGGVVTKRLWSEGYSILALGQSGAKLQVLNEWFCKHLNTQYKQTYFTVAMSFPDADFSRLDTYIQLHTQLGGTVDALVVCHGAPPEPIVAMDCLSVVQRLYEVDVLSTLRLCQTAGRYMIDQRHGSITLLSSIHAHQTYPERLPYVLSKTAVCGMARALAVEWGQYNITVNSISPWQTSGGRTDTVAAQEYASTGANTLGAYKRKSPLHRLVRPEDIAETVVWLAKNQSITGQDIVIDGGVTASAWHKPYTENISHA